jgi:ABC-type lipoprotein export system ATPase subunit
MIGLFPERTGTTEINSQAIHDLVLSPLGISRTAIVAKGREIEPAADEDRAFKKGMFKVQVDFKKAAFLIHKYGGVVVVHAGTKENSLDEEMKHEGNGTRNVGTLYHSLGTVKEELFKDKHIDICEIRKENDNEEFYQTKFGKPSITASDAHSLAEIGQKFVWIKADPTLEGLKQILYEPLHRVFIGNNPPPSPVHRIEHVLLKFPVNVELVDKENSKNEKFCFAGEHTLSFSPNFTCVIGGRGTGKSTLLNLMHERLSAGENEFFNQRKLVSDHLELAPGDCVRVDDDEQKYVEFLSQNEIETFALNQDRFSKAIFDRIDRLDTQHTLNAIKHNLALHQNDINQQIERLKKAKALTVQLDEYRREMKSNQKLTTSFEAPEYVENRELLNTTIAEIQDLERAKKSWVELLRNLTKVVHESSPVKEPSNAYDCAYKEVITGLPRLLSSIRDRSQFEIAELDLIAKSETANCLKKEIELFLFEHGLSSENISDVSKATERIATLTFEIMTAETEHADMLAEMTNFSCDSEYSSKFGALVKTLLEPIVTQLSNVNSEQVRTIGMEYFFNMEQAENDLFEQIYDEVPVSSDGRRYNKEAFKDILFSIPPDDVNNKDDYLRAMREKSVAAKTTDGLCEYFSDETNFEIYKLYIQRFFSDADRYKAIKVTYDGKPLSHTSFGQRCTAAIVVLLLIGNTPIMIDEPEAHLDSALISQYLIGLIKSKKTERQVIFATHNANFVVNGDAELIHILEINADGITQVSSTTIENLDYRQQLLDLEGGAEAFRTRGNKYSS